jgi:hypothetical protein
MSRLLPALALCAAIATPAFAYDEPDRCYTTTDPLCSGDFCGNTFYNPSVTQNWMQTQQLADPKVMQQMAGVYYGQIPDPSQRMTNETYRSYEANGGWQYQDQTCTPGATCSQNQGAGLWAAYPLDDGTIFLMIHFSDLARSNTCFSQTVKLVDGGIYDVSGGMAWRRVR